MLFRSTTNVVAATSVDDLNTNTSKQADVSISNSGTIATPSVIKDEGNDEKGAKKEKPTKPSRMVYSDNEISPEEKMARLSRYSFAAAG